MSLLGLGAQRGRETTSLLRATPRYSFGHIARPIRSGPSGPPFVIGQGRRRRSIELGDALAFCIAAVSVAA